MSKLAGAGWAWLSLAGAGWNWLGMVGAKGVGPGGAFAEWQIWPLCGRTKDAVNAKCIDNVFRDSLCDSASAHMKVSTDAECQKITLWEFNNA